MSFYSNWYFDKSIPFGRNRHSKKQQKKDVPVDLEVVSSFGAFGEVYSKVILNFQKTTTIKISNSLKNVSLSYINQIKQFYAIRYSTHTKYSLKL